MHLNRVRMAAGPQSGRINRFVVFYAASREKLAGGDPLSGAGILEPRP